MEIKVNGKIYNQLCDDCYDELCNEANELQAEWENKIKNIKNPYSQENYRRRHLCGNEEDVSCLKCKNFICDFESSEFSLHNWFVERVLINESDNTVVVNIKQYDFDCIPIPCVFQNVKCDFTITVTVCDDYAAPIYKGIMTNCSIVKKYSSPYDYNDESDLSYTIECSFDEIKYVVCE